MIDSNKKRERKKLIVRELDMDILEKSLQGYNINIMNCVNSDNSIKK